VITSLQSQPTPLLDRDETLETILRRLSSGEVRLLTLTGPVGVGKTRLALEAGLHLADAFPNGVVEVDLGPLRESDRVVPTIAQALGVAARNVGPLLDRLVQQLRDRKLLLVLDDFDRVLPAAAQLGELLALCPGLAILVTSRVPLHLRWEQTLRVAPLAVPDLDHLPLLPLLARVPAVALFLQRTQAVNPDFSLTRQNARSVAELVVQLDGLPLAIELAAARTPLLSPQMIVERLKSRLSVLQWQAPDLPEHQRSLESAIGWSHDLLSSEDRALFQNLGVFVGGFDLEAAEAVLGRIASHSVDVLEGLASLVDKSLIQVTGQGEDIVRYSLLESVREYAREQMEDDSDLDAARRAHAFCFLDLAERADPNLRTREQSIWFQRLEREQGNLREALRWQIDHGEPEMALQLAAALGYFWWAGGHVTEGCSWLEEALRQAPSTDPAMRIRALLWLGAMLTLGGEPGRARPILEEALDLAKVGVDRSAVAQSLTHLGSRAFQAGERQEGARLLREAMDTWQELGERADQHQIAVTLLYLGLVSFVEGNFETAGLLLSDAVEAYEATGDLRFSGVTRLYLALAVAQAGDLPRAVQLARDGIHGSMSVSTTWCLNLVANATVLLMGDRADSHERDRLLRGSEALRQVEDCTCSYWDQWIVERVSSLPPLLKPARNETTSQEEQQLTKAQLVALADAMLDRLSQTLAASETAEKPLFQRGILSDRESEVLQLVAEGLSSKVIGNQLFISASTVNYHLTSIFNKLGVDTRAQAVAVAAQRGIL
jgi:non-specific serine/threonine protein kinase